MTVTVVALAIFGQKARKVAIIPINTAMRDKKAFMTSNNNAQLQTIRCRTQGGKSNDVVTFLETLPACLQPGAACHASIAFAGVDGITNVTDGVNQRRITDPSAQPADEDFDQLCIVFMWVCPNTFAQLGAREDTGRLAH